MKKSESPKPGKKWKEEEIADFAAIWVRQSALLNNREKNLLIEMIKQSITDHEIRGEMLHFFQYQMFKHGKRMKLQK